MLEFRCVCLVFLIVLKVAKQVNEVALGVVLKKDYFRIEQGYFYILTIDRLISREGLVALTSTDLCATFNNKSFMLNKMSLRSNSE